MPLAPWAITFGNGGFNMQPESWMTSPDYAEDIYEQDAINETEHMTGTKMSIWKGGRGISPAAYQWLIVVGALGILWGMHFNFRSVFKAVV